MKNGFLYLSLYVATACGTISAEGTAIDDIFDDATITITAADRVSTPLRDTTANVTVISSEDIKERGFRTLGEALERTTGFSLSSNGGAGQTSGLFLRGFDGGNILITIDGIPLKDPTDPGFSSGLPHIMLDNVKQIEIVKGAQSGIWGADAVAGVVNIVTDTPKKGGEVAIRAGYGSYDTKESGITLSLAGDAGGLIVNADHYFSDSYSAMIPRDAESDQYENNTFDLKAYLNIDKNSKIGIYHRHIDGDYDFDGTNGNDSFSNGTFKESLSALRYDYDDGKLSLDGVLSLNRIDRHIDGMGLWGPYTFDASGEGERAALSFAYEMGKGTLSGGIESSEYIDARRGDSFTNHGIFGSYRYISELFGGRTILNATIRYDDFDKFDSKTTYRLGLKRECSLLKGVFASANLYSAYKAPSLFQWTNRAAGSNLKPEYTKGYEVSMGYEDMLKVTYFRNEIEDMIDNRVVGWTVVYFNRNSSYTIDGLEIESKYRFDSISTLFRANYTRLFSMDDIDGNTLPRRPRESFNLFIDHYLSPDIHIGADIQYVSKRTDKDWSVWPARNVTLESYTLVNLSYNQKIGANLDISLQAHNIFDEDYQTVYGYSTEGRSIYGRIEYRF